MNTKKFIEQLVSNAIITLKSTGEMQNLPFCEKFKTQDFEEFVQGIIPDNKISSLYTHCDSCLSCLYELIRVQKKMEKELDRTENEALLRRTRLFLDQYFNDEKNFFSIITKKIESVLTVISTTGENISPTSVPIVVRGETQQNKGKQPLVINQQFETPPISVQVKLIPIQDTNKVEANISVFNFEDQEFMSEVEVSMNDFQSTQTLTTRELGEVSFLLNDLSSYEAIFLHKEKQIVCLKLVIQA